MKGKNIIKYILILVLVTASCKKNNSEIVQNVPETTTRNPLEYVSLIPFTVDGEDFLYRDYKLISDIETGGFTLYKNNQKLGNITFDGGYDGPGFSVYLAENRGVDNIIIEAEADIGTAWYYSIILENDTIVNQFFIDEPRTNSELYSLDKFITLSISGDSLNYRFKKDLVAKYSEIPKELKSDTNYIYLEKAIRNVNTTVKKNNNTEWQGNYKLELTNKDDLIITYLINIGEENIATINYQEGETKQRYEGIYSIEDSGKIKILYGDQILFLEKIEDNYYTISGDPIYFINPGNSEYQIKKIQ